ncbi:hypothetical protein AGMMS49940_21470 [Spirochaetia bacterium]|nr:hypothetical protein AGMMS49940_21470 [Spirochaetia bacterium]
MADFDVSKPWVILSNTDAAKKGAEELSRLIGLLRRQAGLTLPSPVITGDAVQGPEEAAEIVLNYTEDAAGPVSRNGFAWRAGASRIEIFGNEPRGLYKGIYHFLTALGIGWPELYREALPPVNPASPARYPLTDTSAFQADVQDPALRKRFLLAPGKKRKYREDALVWAARNSFDAIVIPLGEFPFRDGRGNVSLPTLASQYALDIEAGGREFSSLVPRRLFFFKANLFRMEAGRRKKDGLFCTTNPDTLALIQKNAADLFARTCTDGGDRVTIFHLWPEPRTEGRWCSCPSCRAFPPEEQNRIAINAAADALSAINPRALLSYYEPLTEHSDSAEQAGYIAPRANTFRLSCLPTGVSQ